MRTHTSHDEAQGLGSDDLWCNDGHMVAVPESTPDTYSSGAIPSVEGSGLGSRQFYCIRSPDIGLVRARSLPPHRLRLMSI
jgi:hypothetical protein